ncbi:hypothetical protein HVPorG_04757 (plasmid) [Roseomonas mucosa]|nr:hypothetical protein HVPorG_04757 [Roseomonas mucosa]
MCGEAVVGGRRIATYQLSVGRNVSIAHEEHGPVLGIPDYAKRLEATAAAILARAA